MTTTEVRTAEVSRHDSLPPMKDPVSCTRIQSTSKLKSTSSSTSEPRISIDFNFGGDTSRMMVSPAGITTASYLTENVISQTSCIDTEVTRDRYSLSKHDGSLGLLPMKQNMWHQELSLSNKFKREPYLDRVQLGEETSRTIVLPTGIRLLLHGKCEHQKHDMRSKLISSIGTSFICDRFTAVWAVTAAGDHEERQHLARIITLITWERHISISWRLLPIDRAVSTSKMSTYI